MFALETTKLDPDQLKKKLVDPRAGALVTFEGWVRNHNDGRSVESLTYEAFGLAVKEATKIIAEAKEVFEIYDAVCIHRVGDLAIGDLAVWVGVIAAHRGTAFGATKYIIDQIKTRLPIWKREVYSDGSVDWVNCQECTPSEEVPMTPATPAVGHTDFSMPEVRPGFSLPEAQYYARQTILPSVGADGQEKLRTAKVLVIGAGGLGSSALLYLAGAGVGTIGIIDHDLVELANLHRQVMFTRFDIGKSKADSAAARLKSLNPFIDTRVYRERFSRKNAKELFEQYDIVLDCSDNFETKFLANDVALATGIVLVQASIYQYEGQLQLLHSPVKEGRATARYAGQCLRCLWPNLSANAEELNCIGSCAEVGVLGVVPGLFGTMQATETLKYVLGLPTPLAERILIFDLLSYNLRTVKRRINPNCVCQAADAVHPLVALSHAVEPREDFELNYHESKELTPLSVIDVREPAEILVSGQKVKHLWPDAPIVSHPLSAKDNPELQLRDDRKYLVLCARGIRSKRLARTLREQGNENVFSLSGGLAGVSAGQLAAAQAAGLVEVDE